MGAPKLMKTLQVFGECFEFTCIYLLTRKLVEIFKTNFRVATTPGIQFTFRKILLEYVKSPGKLLDVNFLKYS